MTARTFTPDVQQRQSTNPSTLGGTLGAPAITIMVIAAAAPLTMLSGGTPLGILAGNGAGFPVAFLVIGIALFVFSIGFSAMSRHIDGAGAFFTYIGRGLNPTFGLGASTLALFTYAMIQSAIYCFLGLQLSSLVASVTSVSLPWWLYSLASVGLVALLGYRSIGMSAGVLNVLIAGEIGVTIILCVAIFAQGGAHGLDFNASFSPQAAVQGAPGVAIIFAVASFVGFESTAIYRSEARNPDVTVPRATYIAVIFVTVLYLLSSFAIITAWGADDIAAMAAQTLDAGNLLQLTASRYVGDWLAHTISIMVVTSLFAAVLSFHNVLSRYVQSMANAHVLPQSIGHLHARHNSPTRASLIITAMSTAIIAGVVIAGLDPFTQAFSWFSGVAVLGFVLLLFLACVAVIAFFLRNIDARKTEGMARSLIAPIAGSILLLGILGCSLINLADLVGECNLAGEPSFGPICTALIICAVLSFIIGAVVARIMQSRQPESYRSLLTELSE